MEHDIPFVYQVQSEVVQYLKKELSHVIDIEYFSDGCAGQYKNFKNILNLCHHVTDFGITARWSFFATSHGKSPCDGIGGTVKRLVARASLHWTTKYCQWKKCLSIASQTSRASTS